MRRKALRSTVAILGLCGALATPALAYQRGVVVLAAEEPCGVRWTGVGSGSATERDAAPHVASTNTGFSLRCVARTMYGRLPTASLVDASGFRSIRTTAPFDRNSSPLGVGSGRPSCIMQATTGEYFIDSSLWSPWLTYPPNYTWTYSTLVTGNFASTGIVPGVQSVVRILQTSGGAELYRTTWRTASGGLTVIATASPADGTDFSFASTLSTDPACGAFKLDDAAPDDGDAVQHTLALAGALGGTYTITENVPAGWRLMGASCTGNAAGSFAGSTLTVPVVEGAQSTCTFVNRKLGRVTVRQVADNVADQPFDFSGDLGTFTVPAAGEVAGPDVLGGTYSVTETVPLGWRLAGASCTGTSSPATLSGSTLTVPLLDGEAPTCTFTNHKLGHVTVRQVAATPAGQPFDFTGDLGSFSLAPGDEVVSADLEGGNVAITETLPAGWKLAAASCTGGSSAGSLAGTTLTVPLADTGEEHICTFTNEKLGTITVRHVVANPADAPALTLPFGGDLDNFSLADGEQASRGDLADGSYAISATLPAYWSLDGVACTDGNGGPSIVASASGVTISLASAAVTCTFTTRFDDGDGIVAATEDAAVSGGDGNFDGIADKLQPNITSFTSSIGGCPLTLVAPSGISLRDVRTATFAETQGVPSNLVLPCGLLDFTLEGLTPGQQVPVALWMREGGPGDLSYLMRTAAGRWIVVPAEVSSSHGSTVLAFAVTDGGELDADGVADGRFVDPSGPAAAVVSVPAAGSLGLLLLALALAGIGWVRLRSGRAASARS